MEKKTRFFCENCNTEVKRDAKFCNKCGHFFASVKCPACGKIGASSLFKNGCPVCGYAVGGPSEEKIDEPKKKNKLSMKSKKEIKEAFSSAEKKGLVVPKDDGLPAWIYVVTIIVLVLVLFLFLCILGII